jgi:hypothetical protein
MLKWCAFGGPGGLFCSYNSTHFIELDLRIVELLEVQCPALDALPYT